MDNITKKCYPLVSYKIMYQKGEKMTTKTENTLPAFNFNDFIGLSPTEISNKVYNDIKSIQDITLSEQINTSTRKNIVKTVSQINKYEKASQSLINQIVDLKSAHYLVNDQVFADWSLCLTSIKNTYSDFKSELVDMFHEMVENEK